uniref:Uncharacterized protein n=1 Tax=Strigamia maritima TaxID=126957 RepID=T1IRK6_STRMM
MFTSRDNCGHIHMLSLKRNAILPNATNSYLFLRFTNYFRQFTLQVFLCPIIHGVLFKMKISVFFGFLLLFPHLSSVCPISMSD